MNWTLVYLSGLLFTMLVYSFNKDVATKTLVAGSIFWPITLPWALIIMIRRVL